MKVFYKIGEYKINFSEQISEGVKTLSLILVFFKKINIVLNKEGKKQMNKQEQLKFFTIFKEDKINFETLLENVFLEYIQEKENESVCHNP